MGNQLRFKGLGLAGAEVLLAVLFPVQLFAQTDTVMVQDFFEAGEGAYVLSQNYPNPFNPAT